MYLIPFDENFDLSYYANETTDSFETFAKHRQVDRRGYIALGVTNI